MYVYSPSWTPLPSPSLSHLSGSSHCTSPKHPVSCIKPGLAIHLTCDILHVSMPFFHIILPSPSPGVQKTVQYTCVSFAVSHIGFSHYFLKYSFSPLFWHCHFAYMLVCFMVPRKSFRLFFFFIPFTFCFSECNLNCPIFRLTDSSFYVLRSAIELLLSSIRGAVVLFSTILYVLFNYCTSTALEFLFDSFL